MVPDPKKSNAHGLSRKHILDAVEGSLKRLQNDYIDLYQVCISEASSLPQQDHPFNIFTPVKSPYLDIV